MLSVAMSVPEQNVNLNGQSVTENNYDHLIYQFGNWRDYLELTATMVPAFASDF